MILDKRDFVISEIARMESLLTEIQERITHINPLAYRSTRPSIKLPTSKDGSSSVGTPQQRKDVSRLLHLAISGVVQVGVVLTPGYEFDDANLIQLRLIQLHNKLDSVNS
jgi:hypothetical protein